MSILRWATASQTTALDNARAAAVECSRRRLERAEVAQFLEDLHGVQQVTAARAAGPTLHREMNVRAGAR